MNENEPTPASREPGEREPLRPRIYAASLSDYNAGRLHGSWLDANQDAEALAAGVADMLARSREPFAEEFAVHDYEGFGPLAISEYESLDAIARLGQAIDRHGFAFAAYAAHTDHRDSDIEERFDTAYRGSWPSVDEYVSELLDDMGASQALEQLPDWLQLYIHLDVAGLARDLQLGGELFAVDDPGGDEVHIFEVDE